MKFNIKQRGFIVFSVIIVFVVVLSLIGYTTISELNTYSEYSNSFENIQSRFKEAKNQEKELIEFDSKIDEILEGTKESEKYNFVVKALDQSKSELDSLKSTPISIKFELEEEIDSLISNYTKYGVSITQLFEAFKTKGFTKSGLEGELRGIIHEVEEIEQNQIKPNFIGYDRGYALMLRRKEKDFFLRKKEKYHTEFLEKVENYKSYLTSISDTISEDSIGAIVKNAIENIIPKVDAYAESFTKNVEINRVIGFNANSGVNKNLNAIYSTLNGSLNDLTNKVVVLSASEHDFWIKGFWISTILLIIVILLASYWYLRSILNPLNKIKVSLASLSNSGDSETQISTGEELIDIALNLDNLKERIDTAADFSKEIGSGNLDITYDERFSDDVLAQSVIEMRDKLKESAKEELVRSWRTEGIAKFGTILQEEKDNLQALSKILVSHLCQYLDANQAGIFVVNNEDEDNEFLELSGAYAYERDKHVEMVFKKGEGLVGQCWQEQKRIFMTDIPNGYINISSGLGDAAPNCVVILPLVYNEAVLGVLEMATFKAFTEAEILFLEDLAKNIAATLSGVKVASRTKDLLEESKMMQESLQAQEEEMRQNMEEMQATQDMMTEKENDYMGKIKALEKQIRLLESGK